MARVSLPVDLGGGLAIEDAVIKQYYEGVERGARGFFPLGAAGTWHGGIHVYANPGAVVHACADGWVVACRLNSDPEAIKGPFGSTNFILVRHEAKGRIFNKVAPAADLEGKQVYTWFSLYMHLGALEAAEGTAELAEVTWLGEMLEGEIIGSVGRRGRNRRKDTELVQKMLTRAGIDPGPIDGFIGPKTNGAILKFQEALYSNPDGRIDVGGSTWAALVHAAAGAPKDHGFDADLLQSVANGGLVVCEKPVGAGDPLWVVGPDADGQSHLVHWEIFSEHNVLNGIPAVSDESPFQADTLSIIDKLKGKDWFGEGVLPAQRDIARFYAGNKAAQGLRDYAAFFQSEWGLDLAAAIKAMEPYVFTDGLAEQLEPYQWFKPDQLAAAGLPDPLCWHYHPVRFCQQVAQMYQPRALPPPWQPQPSPADPDAPEPTESDAEAPEPADEGMLLFDAKTGLTYIITKAEYERLLRDNAKLRAKKDALKAALIAAKDLDADQKINAVAPQLEELLELTQDESVNVSGIPTVDGRPSKLEKMRVHKEWTEELWAMGPNGGKRPIYVGPKSAQRMAAKALHKAPLKKMVKAAQHPASGHIAPIKFEIIDDEMKKKYPWLQGGGSLLDFIDSANPGVVGYIFGGLWGMDYFFEKYPRIFRKGLQGKWESKSGNLDASGEARLLRWGYETKLGGVINPRQGRAEFRGALGGSVDLISGKGEANWYITKEGFPLPLTVGDEIKVRFHLKGEISGSVGVAAELSAGTAVQWKPDKDDNFMGARADAGVDLFAGAQVTGRVTFGVEWYRDSKWYPLAEASVGGIAIAGVAFTAKFYIDFDGRTGKFEIYFKAQLAVKLGLGFDTKAQIHAFELVRFLWTLLTKADWGRIAELSFEAFIKASEFLVASAITGSPIGGLTYTLVKSFSSWWSNQDRISDLANNINDGKASVLLTYGTPEAKGMTIHKLTGASWIWDETSETAALAVLKSARSRREVEQILKSVDPDGRDPQASASDRRKARTVQRGYDLMSGLVDWGEQDELDNFLIGWGIQVD